LTGSGTHTMLRAFDYGITWRFILCCLAYVRTNDMRALVVGGTGPTGPLVVRGLLDRGYEVTMYHRGYHELEEMPDVHYHLHGDPFGRDDLEKDFGSSTWDLVLGMYGRVRYLADLMARRTARFICVGGTPSLVQPRDLPFPRGLEFPLSEEHPTYTDRSVSEYGFAVAETERRVMAHHDQGHYAATLFRYTGLYGPRVPRNWVWPIARRALDGRPHIIVPGDGSQLRPMASVENAAHQVLLACDKPESSGHLFYSVDEKTYTLKEAIRLIGEALSHSWEVVEITHPLAYDLTRGYAPRRSQQLSADKLKAVLGYRDVVPPDEGIRNAARWLAEHRHLLDEPQFDEILADPYAYALEDRLIASFRQWQLEASSSIPRPDLRAPVQEFRGPFRPRDAQ